MTGDLSYFDRYEGELKNGMRHGKGAIILHNGDVYRGEFFKNKMHGRGVYVHENGNMYEGQFRNGKKEGKGSMIFDSGDLYEGQFSDNKMNGPGVYYSARLRLKYQGNFKNGELEKPKNITNFWRRLFG